MHWLDTFAVLLKRVFGIEKRVFLAKRKPILMCLERCLGSIILEQKNAFFSNVGSTAISAFVLDAFIHR